MICRMCDSVLRGPTIVEHRLAYLLDQNLHTFAVQGIGDVRHLDYLQWRTMENNVSWGETYASLYHQIYC